MSRRDNNYNPNLFFDPEEGYEVGVLAKEEVAIKVMTHCCDQLVRDRIIPEDNWDKQEKTLAKIMDASQLLEELNVITLSTTMRELQAYLLEFYSNGIKLDEIYKVVCEHQDGFYIATSKLNLSSPPLPQV